jgi:hypothetical protein
MIENMDTELTTFIILEMSIKETLTKDPKKAKESICTLMEIFIKGTFTEEIKKEKVLFIMQMVLLLQAASKITF